MSPRGPSQRPHLTTRILEDASEASAIRMEWHDLALRAPRGELVLTPMWVLAWWREFGTRDGRKLRMITFWDGETLVGLAPLSYSVVLHRGAIPVRRIALLGNGEDEQHEVCSDYAGLLCDDGYGEAIVGELVRLLRDGALGHWDELLMPMMNGEDPIADHLRQSFEAAGLTVTVEESGSCPYVTLPKTWDEYLKQLEGSSRYLVTRSIRELEKWAGPGGIALVRASSRAELAEGRRILGSLHTERWGEVGQSGAFASERFTRFHDEVMPQLLEGQDADLDLFWLTVKGEPIAAVYNMVFRGKVYFYQSGRKVDVPKQVRPGIAIHALVMQRSIAQGRREYDFLNGASQYKLKLATATRRLVTLRAVAPSIRARAVEGARHFAEAMVGKVREKLSSIPPSNASSSASSSAASSAGSAGEPGSKRSDTDGG